MVVAAVLQQPHSASEPPSALKLPETVAAPGADTPPPTYADEVPEAAVAVTAAETSTEVAAEEAAQPSARSPDVVPVAVTSAVGLEAVQSRLPLRQGAPEPYAIRAIQWGGTPSAVICQNTNGPCPLLALCNVLLLRGKIHLHPDAGVVTFQHLIQLLSAALLDSPKPRDLPPEQRAL